MISGMKYRNNVRENYSEVAYFFIIIGLYYPLLDLKGKKIRITTKIRG